MNGVLIDLKRAECTISGVKSQFCMPKIRVIEFICDILERHPNISKIIKIIEWPPPTDVSEVKAFIKVAVYYKIFIKNFTLVAAPIYALIRKGVRFA